MSRKKRISHLDGPNIVAIGGGTGLSTMLRGLKNYTANLTAIVTMADDGGGSGKLREDLGMPPPRGHPPLPQALANAEPLMEELINYRFTEGTLAGQSFGNLFLAALNGISDSFEEAVSRMSQVLAITGRVLPVTSDNIQLVAEFENGTQVVGESKICDFKKAQDCRITKVQLIPEHARVNQEALEAIAKADLILLGPGSLYTSVIPNLLVEGDCRRRGRLSPLRAYICNVMTQDRGRPRAIPPPDHLRALLTHSGQKLVDFCLVNSAPIPAALLPLYAKEDAGPSGWTGRP